MQRILFVDDEVAVLDGLRRMLRSMHETWDMTFVLSAEQALNQIRDHSFDAIVLDVMMPRMNGLELLAELQEMACDVPIVVLTGNKEHDLKRRSLDLGATDLLNKPVGREDMIARLHSVLLLKACQDDLKAHNRRLEHRVAERTAELADSRLEIVWRLGKAAEYRDEETGNHILRVGAYCRVIAETLGMPPEFVELIFLSSPLHDIGKVAIPDSILHKGGALTHEERAFVKQHCRIGAEILLGDRKMPKALRAEGQRTDTKASPNPTLKMAASIALAHHERWDGEGYPNGLSGVDIPIEARIVAVSDVYDALRSERPYKPAYSEEEAVETMRQEVGRHFDPHVYQAFEDSLSCLRTIAEEFADDIRMTPAWSA